MQQITDDTFLTYFEYAGDLHDGEWGHGTHYKVATGHDVFSSDGARVHTAAVFEDGTILFEDEDLQVLEIEQSQVTVGEVA